MSLVTQWKNSAPLLSSLQAFLSFCHPLRWGSRGSQGYLPSKTNICCHVLSGPDPRITLWRRDAGSCVTLCKANKHCNVGWACPPLVYLGRAGLSRLAGVGRGISGHGAAPSAPSQRCARKRVSACLPMHPTGHGLCALQRVCCRHTLHSQQAGTGAEVSIWLISK